MSKIDDLEAALVQHGYAQGDEQLRTSFALGEAWLAFDSTDIEFLADLLISMEEDQDVAVAYPALAMLRALITHCPNRQSVIREITEIRNKAAQRAVN